MKQSKKYYETYIGLNALSSEDFLAIVRAVCKDLDWAIDYASPTGLIVYGGTSLYKGSIKITIRKTDDGMHLVSENADLGSFNFEEGKNEAHRFAELFASLQETLTNEEKEAAYEAVKEKFTTEGDFLASVTHNESNEKTTFLDLFKKRNSYKITLILVAINILVFVIMGLSGVSVIEPTGEDIFNWGGNFGAATLSGQWWRIITCTFVHIGFLHLAMNMYGLLYAGTLLEPLIGTKRFITCYILTGITSSLLSLYWHPNIVSAGASGAIFGLFGTLIAMLSTNLLHKQLRKTLLPNMAIYVGYNLLYGMKEGIDNAGHIGGLIGGLIIGLAFYPTLTKGATTKLRNAIIITLSLLVVVAGAITFKFTSNADTAIQGDLAIYQETMEKYFAMEESAIKIMVDETSSVDKQLTQLRDSGLYYWDENIKLLNTIKALNLPANVLVQNEMLMYYTSIRKEATMLLYKRLAENTDKYDAKITELYLASDSMITRLTEANNDN